MTPRCYRCYAECEPTDEVESGYVVYVCAECGAENVDVGEVEAEIEVWQAKEVAA